MKNYAHTIVITGFSQNQCVLLSCLIRKLWKPQNLIFAESIEQMEEALLTLSKRNIKEETSIIVSGWMDFYHIHGVIDKAASFGVKVAGAIFFEGVKSLSLAECTGNNIPVILSCMEKEDELYQCEKNIAQGQKWWSDSVYNKVQDEPMDFPDLMALFSHRESQCCIAMLSGKTHQEIAYTLGITKSAVDTYCSRVYKKAGVRTLTELEQIFAGRNY